MTRKKGVEKMRFDGEEEGLLRGVVKLVRERQKEAETEKESGKGSHPQEAKL